MASPRSIGLSLLLLILYGPGDSCADEPVDAGSVGSHEKFIETVEKSQEAQFEDVVDRYERHLAIHPDDAVAATERCHFVSYFAYAEDFYLESAGDLLEEYESYLERFENEPVVELYRLGSVYGEDAIEKGEQLLDATRIDWTDEQLAEIHLTLARQYGYNKSPEQSRQHAKMAFEKHPTHESQLLWGTALKDEGRKAAAVEVLKEQFPDEDSYQKRSRMNLLSGLGDEDSALALLDQLNEAEDPVVNQFEIARIYARAGRVEKARAAFAGAMETGWNKEAIAREAFALERRYGDAESVLGAYNDFRDQGYRADPVLRYRLGLLNDYPMLPWRVRDVLGLLGLLGCAIGLALAPLLFLLPIHYWGLLREKKGKTGLQWTPGWGLRRAWLVLAVYTLVMTGMNYLFGYETLVWGWSSDNSEMPSIPSLSLARIFLFGDILVFTGLILCLGLGLFRSFVTTDWSVTKAVGMALVFVIPVKILAGINDGVAGMFQSPPADTSILTEMLNAALKHYGPFGLIFGVAIMTPLIEEVIFRGVMLTAIVKYIPFGWANALQAFAFMIVHEHYEFFPFLFCFGLICGYLRKESGGLLPGILLHAFHNGLIALGLIIFAR